MRVLIVEEALHKQGGHWVSYIGAIASEMRKMGDAVDVLTHREAEEEVVREVGGTRWLRRSVWSDPRSKGLLGGFVHNWIFYRDLAAFFDRNEPYDLVLALTMRVQHLLAFARLACSSRSKRCRRFVLLFLNGFSVYSGPGCRPRIPISGAALTFILGVRYMRSAILAGRVMLTGQVRARCDELQRMTGLPCKLLPQPVSIGSAARRGRQSKELLLLHPGFARHEKGSHLLQQAIVEVLAESPELPVRFVVQWVQPFAMPDGTSVAPLPALREHPKVELIPRALPLVEYDALLDRTDAMVLPYLADSYYARDSRASIEAAVLGMPAIYTRHTWLEEHFNEYGSGIAVDEDVASLKAGIRALIESFDSKKEQALAKADLARRYYSVENFRELIQRDAVKTPHGRSCLDKEAITHEIGGTSGVRRVVLQGRTQGPPILLTGAPRTGKTLIAGSLMESGRLWILREPFSNYRGENHRSELVRALTHTYTHIDGSNEKLFIDDVVALFHHPTYCVRLAKDRGLNVTEAAKCAGKILRAFPNSARRPLIDDPFLLFSAEWMERRLGALVIVMIRNPADFVANCKVRGEGFDFRNLVAQRGLMAGPLKCLAGQIEHAAGQNDISPVTQSALLWKALYHVVNDYRERLPHWKFLRFEDLVRNPEEQIRALYQQLSFPIDARLERRLQTYLMNYDTAEYAIEHGAGDVRYPFQTANALHRKVLTGEELEIVRTITIPVARNFYQDAEWL